ncbi:MAG: efflux transporter outer membrane factor lipoprotein NodT family [Hyphomonadaceae bacterium]|nr:MAG: efflux transporter outer membrane factor lipoprotein NodT family [Hyphomonadaceae bacterium]
MTFSKSKSSTILAITILSILTIGCAHKYSPAYNGAPNVALGQDRASQIGAPIALSNWWQNLNDETLTHYIEVALRNNHDIAQSMARITEARQVLGSYQASARPSGNLGASASAQRMTENGAMPVARLPGFDRDQLVFQTGFDASWEIDVFNGVKHYLAAQTARIEVSEEEKNAVQIVVAAEVGRAYFELQGAQRELEYEKDYIESLNQTVDLLQSRNRAGDISQRDITEVMARKAAYETKLPAIEARIRAANIALQVIQGIPPSAQILSVKTDEPLLLRFPIGARSELLQRRPDIRIAERRLAVRTNETAVQMVEKYPRFVISARLGWEATEPLKIFDTSSQAINIAPGIRWNILNGGRIEANIHAAEARQTQALEAYSQTIIAALGDSERAFSDYHGSLETIASRAQAIEIQQNLIAYGEQRLAAGDISWLELLEMGRAVMDLQIQDVRNKTQAATLQIALFKALGGGWSE